MKPNYFLTKMLIGVLLNLKNINSSSEEDNNIDTPVSSEVKESKSQSWYKWLLELVLTG